MATGRTLRSLVSRRRRAEDEGEDEEGPDFGEESQSEGSVVSEPEDDEEVEASSVVGNGTVPEEKPEGSVRDATEVKKARKVKTRSVVTSGDTGDAAEEEPQRAAFKAMADTEAMMNGLKVGDSDGTQEQVADFETLGQNGAEPVPARANNTTLQPAVQQRREHEEYRKKRDADPAFIPNRGNFFMHDTRGQPHGPAPMDRGPWAGNARGKGANVGGPFSPANQMAAAERASEQQWKHDLHDTINEESGAFATPRTGPQGMPPAQPQSSAPHLFPRAVPRQQPPTTQPPSFDTTTLLGTVQMRVFLPGMKAPVTFADAPARRYVRLPNHRPPLRRDKPVRVFLPYHIQRYIFPATERSFVFIPRQMRPNQQGFHRGGYQRSVGGYGYSSRRTSVHGSMYSGSVAASRRSSMAGVSRDRAFSPAGSFVGMPPSRPTVRLPHGSNHGSAISTPVGPLSGYHTPTGVVHTYPLPQAPQFQGTPTTTMYQPRPQKTISVTGIESPAILQQALSEPQPFQGQLPAHLNEQPAYQKPFFSPRQQFQYPQMQPPSGTPLSGIPEQALHSGQFQPPGYGQQSYYGYPPQQNYYYSPPGPNGYPQMPMYMMPPPQQGYMLPPAGPPMNAPPPQPPAPQQQPSVPPPPADEQDGQQSSQSGMVAHESNGMVFYVPASEAQSSEQQYQPAEGFVPSYAMPGLPPPTPAPDNQMQYYYPPIPHPNMQDASAGVYYPTQQ